jgi:glutaredoxin
MNIKLYNTQRCPYARRTRIVLHEKSMAFQKHKPSQATVPCASQ